MKLQHSFLHLVFLPVLFNLSSCSNNPLEPITYCSDSKETFWVNIDGNDQQFCEGNQHNNDSIVVDTLNVVGYIASSGPRKLTISFCYKHPGSINNEEEFQELYNYFEKLFAPRTEHLFEKNILQSQGSIAVELWDSNTHYSTLYGPQSENSLFIFTVITEYNGLWSQIASFITIGCDLQCDVYSEDGKSKKHINTLVWAEVSIN